MLNAEQNRRLLQEIDANRRFLLLAYRSNPGLLAREDERIRLMLAAVLPEPIASIDDLLSMKRGEDPNG